MKLDDIIGDVIFISFKDTERMREIGIEKPSGHYMLRGYDRIGLWVEHPGVLIQHIEDEKGRPLPPDQQSQNKIDALFMINWDNVNTMMHYPNRKGFDFPIKVSNKIGFTFNEKQKAKKK